MRAAPAQLGHAHDELNPSPNRLEEAFIARLLRNLPDNIRPLLLAGRGFGRASLLRWLPECLGTPAARWTMWRRSRAMSTSKPLGMERYLTTPEPPPRWFGLPTT